MVNKQLKWTYCPTPTARSKGNQTMKFDQLIEYNKRNIFSLKIMRK